MGRRIYGADTMTRRMMLMLANAPRGLSTAQLAAQVRTAYDTDMDAVRRAGLAMRLHEDAGNVKRAGSARTGLRSRAAVWRITPAGLAALGAEQEEAG